MLIGQPVLASDADGPSNGSTRASSAAVDPRSPFGPAAGPAEEDGSDPMRSMSLGGHEWGGPALAHAATTLLVRSLVAHRGMYAAGLAMVSGDASQAPADTAECPVTWLIICCLDCGQAISSVRHFAVICPSH